MIRFAAPEYEGGRHRLMSGTVTVGAVFPPVGTPPGKWAWRIFALGQQPAIDGQSKDETHAKDAALKAFTDFLKGAHLVPELTTT